MKSVKTVKREDFTNELQIAAKFYDQDFNAVSLQLRWLFKNCAELPTKDLKSILEH